MASLGFGEGLTKASGPGGLAGCSFSTVGSVGTGPGSDSEGFSQGMSKSSTTDGLGDGLGCTISGAGVLTTGSWNPYINEVLYEINHLNYNQFNCIQTVLTTKAVLLLLCQRCRVHVSATRIYPQEASSFPQFCHTNVSIVNQIRT
jgi:hypothetical protein